MFLKILALNLSLYSCGITAIAPCSENLFVSKSILEDLKKRFKYIVVFYDNDIPGISNMRKIKKDYPFYAVMLYTGLRISEAIGLIMDKCVKHDEEEIVKS